jgi:hypothetical protein
LTLQLLEVRIFLTYDGFVSILKKLTLASVATVKCDSVSRKQPSHYRGKGNESCAKKEMIGHENPGVDDKLSVEAQLPHATQEIIPVLLVPENLRSLDAPTHHPAKRGTGHRGHLIEPVWALTELSPLCCLN